MGSRSVRTHFLQATLCEVERGLFHVSYLTDTADSMVLGLPAYQVATCAADAKQQIEARAQNCGFDTVVWDYAHEVPPLLSEQAAETAPAISATG